MLRNNNNPNQNAEDMDETESESILSAYLLPSKNLSTTILRTTMIATKNVKP
ncbi:MAG: hypothetical protein CM1200mP35_05880 [Chloroflexota bacterium]|nr:MAG: hypothetical protein CM1200mP35_05880 [Chloroflexota bacterium]